MAPMAPLGPPLIPKLLFDEHLALCLFQSKQNKIPVLQHSTMEKL